MLNDFGAHPADRVPKAELHAHLEGTIHPPVLRQLWLRATGFPCRTGFWMTRTTISGPTSTTSLKVYDSGVGRRSKRPKTTTT